jgi:hypothetical protein
MKAKGSQNHQPLLPERKGVESRGVMGFPDSGMVAPYNKHTQET